MKDQKERALEQLKALKQLIEDDKVSVSSINLQETYQDIKLDISMVKMVEVPEWIKGLRKAINKNE